MDKRSKGTLAIILLLLTQGFLACGAVEIKPSRNPVPVGETLILSLSPTPSLKGGSWAVAESLILNWLGDQQLVFSNHTGRASVNVQSGALTLSSVTVADSGVYKVQSSDPEIQASVSITVLEPASNVMVSVSPSPLREFNSSAVMACSASSGSSLSFLWLNRSSEVTAGDRVQLADRNATLTIVNVTRYDQGPFQCSASNPVSNVSSDAVNLTISYGPDNMAILVNGLNTTFFLVGSNLTMCCSAQSGPPAQLQWAFRGEPVGVTGPLLQLLNVTEQHSGPYSCLAFNNHTNTLNNITTNILIAKSPLSGSEQQAVNVFLLCLWLLVGFIASYPDIGGPLSLSMPVIQ